MSDLKMYEKAIFEKLFDRGVYVLDFSDRTFAEFFRESEINIDDNKHYINGTSKMKRLRAFWEIEPNIIVGKVLHELLLYAKTIQEIDSKDSNTAIQNINRLLGKSDIQKNGYKEIFPNTDLLHIDISKLNLEPTFAKVINDRLQEIQQTLKQLPL